MTDKFIVSAFGKDRPGIVADVTRVLYENECNLEDTRMANLSGEFSLLILFSGTPAADLEATLIEQYKRLGSEKNISVYIRPVHADTEKPVAMVATHTLMVEGLDHTGIVYMISQYLADQQINIANLDSFITFAPESGAQIYTMELHIEVPSGAAMDVIESGLGRLADELNVEITIQKSLRCGHPSHKADG